MDYNNEQPVDSTATAPEDISSFILPGGVFLKDGDTFGVPDGRIFVLDGAASSRTIRLEGANAAETQKFGPDKIAAAQFGADTQTKMVHQIAQDEGYNIPIFTGRKDVYNRDIGDLGTADGRRLSNRVLGLGILDPLMANDNQITAMNISRLNAARDAALGKAPSIAQGMLAVLNEERNQQGLTAKKFTNTAAEYGASLDSSGKSRYFTGPAIVRADEDYKGFAKSNISTGLSSGISSMAQGGWSALDMLGRMTGSDYLANMGQRNARANEADLSDLPQLRNGEAFSETGEWKLDSFSKLADYTIGTAASSAPQMMMSIAAVAAAPFTMGTSLAAPAVVYAGQTWAAQKEKNAGWAIVSGITQTVLEELSIGKIAGNIFHKATQEQVVAQLIKKGYTKETAEKAIVDASQTAIKDITDAAASGAAKATPLTDVEIARRAIIHQSEKSIPKAMLEGVISETPTEMAQEITQYWGEQGSFALPDDPTEQIKLKNRILNAGVGGLVLGGSFGGAGKVASNVLTRTAPTTPQSSDTAFRAKLQEYAVKQGDLSGSVDTARDVIEAVNADNVENGVTSPTLADLSTSEQMKRSIAGVAGKVANWWNDKGLSSVYGKWSETLAGNDGHAGPHSAALWTLLGANRAFNGGSIEEQQSHTAQQLQNAFGSPEEVRAAFKNATIPQISAILSNPHVQETITTLLDSKRANKDMTVENAAGKIDVPAMLGKYKDHTEAVIKYADRLDTLIQAYNKKTDSSLNVKEFLAMKPIERSMIQRHPAEFASLLTKHLGLTTQEAQEAITRLTGDMDVNYIHDAFDDLFSTNPNASAVRSNIEKVLNDPANSGVFNKFLSHDMLQNVYSLAAKGAASYVHTNLIGKDGAHLAALLNAVVNDGEISEDRASFVAKELQDWIAMRQGSYHEVKNPYVKGALSVVNFLSTVSSLPLAAVSSTVEFAQIYRNLNTSQSMKATMALLKGAGAEMANVVQKIGRMEASKGVKDYKETLFQSGFNSTGDIGRRNDVVTGYFQKWTEGFFKLTGLTSVTNITRYAKLSIGADAMKHWLNVIQKDDPQKPSQAARDAREHLTRIGVNVEYLLSVDHESDMHRERVFHEFTNGAHNFTTEAVIHPTKMNRPKFYSDPYLQLFTQFQGYVSAFTANILPRLLGDLRKTGSADQTNAAATIAMMFALGFIALYMKDIIKYGESPPEWLKEEKKFQRYIGQVGLLGTGQRLWDTVSSVIPNNTPNQSVLASAYKQVSDQAPALAYINKVNEALSAPAGQQISKTMRTVPIFGTSPLLAKYIQKELGE